MKALITITNKTLNDHGKTYEVEVLDIFFNGVRAKYKGQVMPVLYEDAKVTLLRNWLEEAIKKQLSRFPVCIGYKCGRKYYALDFTDGTSGDYFIDFEKKEVEEC